MKQEPKAGRRIVSRGEYIASLCNKGVGFSVGMGLFTLSLVCILVTGIIIWKTIFHGKPEPDLLVMVFVCFIIVPLTCGATFLCRLGTRACLEANQVDTGVLLTRANTADLPAPDSLVRASEEPVSVQETVLLRAAKARQERHEEQLLRASVGGEQA